MIRTIPAMLAVLGLCASGASQAVPCGDYATYGGVNPSTACRDGAAGDAADSVNDLNSGNFFGFNDWGLLDKTDDGVASALWTVSPAGTGVVSGTFTLASDIWTLYSDIAVVLKNGGSTQNNQIKWSAYLLPSGMLGPFDWAFDHHKRVSHMSIYARGEGSPPNTVPEPASLALVLTGLAAIGFTRRLAPARD